MSDMIVNKKKRNLSPFFIAKVDGLGEKSELGYFISSSPFFLFSSKIYCHGDQLERFSPKKQTLINKFSEKLERENHKLKRKKGFLGFIAKGAFKLGKLIVARHSFLIEFTFLHVLGGEIEKSPILRIQRNVYLLYRII